MTLTKSKGHQTGKKSDRPLRPPLTATAQQSQSPSEAAPPQEEAQSPTRYGDWVKNGRCIDF